jgi:hypothetical protein
MGGLLAAHSTGITEHEQEDDNVNWQTRISSHRKLSLSMATAAAVAIAGRTLRAARCAPST